MAPKPKLVVGVVRRPGSEERHQISLASRYLQPENKLTFRDAVDAVEKWLRSKAPAGTVASVKSVHYADLSEVAELDDLICEELEPRPLRPGVDVDLWAVVPGDVLKRLLLAVGNRSACSTCSPRASEAALVEGPRTPDAPAPVLASCSDVHPAAGAPAVEGSSTSVSSSPPPSPAASASATSAGGMPTGACGADLAPSPGARRRDLLSEAARPRLERRVFISHTGKDEGAKNFAASILRPALEAAGLTVYVDCDSIKPGSEWPAELVCAAANSMVFVAVLSKQYYTRFWCMLELDLALNAHAQAPAGGGEQGRARPVVIPVMYDPPEDVLPSDAAGDDIAVPRKVVRQWTARKLSQVLRDEEELPAAWAAWVDAEEWAGNLAATKGLYQHLRRAAYMQRKGHDLQLARDVVAAAVLQIPPLAAVSAGLVGVEQRRAKLLSEVKGRLGLWLSGPGGLGKSTMAKDLRNWLAVGFSHSAFVSVLETDSLQDRAAQVLKELTGADHGGDAATLSAKLQEFVAGRKVLYVLDNVWTWAQLDALLPTRWGEGSVVIVTSRSAGFPDSDAYLQVKSRLLHTTVELLDDRQALQLFRWAAGARACPPALRELEADIVGACGGLPLALRLAGGVLNGAGSDEHVWQGVLHALKTGDSLGSSEGRLQGVVTQSLQRLAAPRASMFLDVATLLRGRPLGHALAVWRAWWGPAAHLCFEDLRRCSLAGVDEEGRLSMHGVLVALGHGIVLKLTPGFEQHYGSRVWVEAGGLVGRPPGDAGSKVLAAQLSLHPTQSPPAACPGAPDMVLDLPEARILWLEGEGAANVRAHGKVLWLELRRCGSDALAPWMRRKPPLVILDAPRQDAVGLGEAACCMPNLGVVSLRGCRQVARLPESVGRLSALRELDLSGCAQLASLAESFTQLASLQVLNLSGCQQMASLPLAFGHLAALQRLELRGWKQLASLPGSFGQLSSLRVLYLSGCTRLAGLPDGIGRLPALQLLVLSECEQLASLPEPFEQLPELRELHLSGCSQLASLPQSFGHLPALQKLELGRCKTLASLPESFGQLSALQVLDLHDCAQLASLPESFGHLSALQKLNLSGCSQLASLPGTFGQLSALQRLGVNDCSRLASLPDSFWQLAALQKLSLSGCKKLTSLPDSFVKLSALQRLDLTGCKQLVSLPESFGELAALQRLNMSFCRQLVSLPAVPESLGLSSTLQELDLRQCKQLVKLPDSFGQLLTLQKLELVSCPEVASLPRSFGQLTALTRLNLRDCTKLQPLPEVVLTLQRQLGPRLELIHNGVEEQRQGAA